MTNNQVSAILQSLTVESFKAHLIKTGQMKERDPHWVPPGLLPNGKWKSGYGANAVGTGERSRLHSYMSHQSFYLGLKPRGWRFLDNRRLAIREKDGLVLTLAGFENCELHT